MFKVPTAVEQGMGYGQIKPDSTPQQQLQTNEKMFGSNTATVVQGLAKSTGNITKKMQEAQLKLDASERIRRGRTELSNANSNLNNLMEEFNNNYGDNPEDNNKIYTDTFNQIVELRDGVDNLDVDPAQQKTLFENYETNLSKLTSAKRQNDKFALTSGITNDISALEGQGLTIGEHVQAVADIVRVNESALTQEEALGLIKDGSERVVSGNLVKALSGGNYEEARSHLKNYGQFLSSTQSDSFNKLVNDQEAKSDRFIQAANMIPFIYNDVTGEHLSPEQYKLIRDNYDHNLTPLENTKNAMSLVGVHYNNLTVQQQLRLNAGNPSVDIVNPNPLSVGSDLGKEIKDREKINKRWIELNDKKDMGSALTKPEQEEYKTLENYRANFKAKNEEQNLKNEAQSLENTLTKQEIARGNARELAKDVKDQEMKHEQQKEFHKMKNTVTKQVAVFLESTLNGFEQGDITFDSKKLNIPYLIDVMTDIAEGRKGFSGFKTGAMGSFLSLLPFSDSGAAQGALEGLKARDILDAIKSLKKTGATLGAVSTYEAQFLAALQGQKDVAQPEIAVGYLLDTLKTLNTLDKYASTGEANYDYSRFSVEMFDHMSNESVKDMLADDNFNYKEMKQVLIEKHGYDKAMSIYGGIGKRVKKMMGKSE